MANLIGRKTLENGTRVALVKRGVAFFVAEQVAGQWEEMTTVMSETVARRFYDNLA